MKLVIQKQNKTEVKALKEYEFQRVKEAILSKYIGYQQFPRLNELFRFKIPYGIIIIYKKNRIQHSKDSWYEIRALSNLANYLNISFYHQQKLKDNNGQITEIDGLDVSTKSIMIEVKRAKINQNWINFYENKRKKLNLKECYLIAPYFEKDLIFPKNINSYKLTPDFNPLIEYYSNRFYFPNWLKSYIHSRHIRFFLNNGKWSGLKRQLTKTAKHTPESKLRLIFNSYAKKGKFPIKIYYSLAHMLSPVEEYYGKGRPLSRIIVAFDVDSDPHNHIIGRDGFCLDCLKNSSLKAKIISEKLDEMGKTFIRLYSGKKGFHFYILNNANNIAEELSEKELNILLSCFKIEDNSNLIDNINFRAKDGTFDILRIFKLPNTVDGTTGIIVKKEFEKLTFHDKLERIH